MSQLSIVGNLTADPELRFTPSGDPVANFTVAHTPRHFDKRTNAWVDEETQFWRCSVWRATAENVAQSLERGARVMVVGRVKARTFQTREGESRTVFEVDVDEVGPSLRYATVKVARTERTSSAAPDTVPDAWASTPAASGAGQLGDEPPF